MRIGIDAKRIFSNATGLGVYGRNLVYGLRQLESSHHFVLYTPDSSNEYLQRSSLSSSFEIHSADKLSSYYWRTFSIKQDIQKDKIDIYHGLSNELPLGIEKLSIKKIVDIHDLCFERFKEDYSWLDRQIFWFKTKRAVRVCDKIIATSEATKKDIIDLLKVPSEKIEVVYQCADKIFNSTYTIKAKTAVKRKYNLPDNYILSVGTIQGRKNQKTIVEALALLPPKERLPLILVGNGDKYLQELLQLAAELKVEVQVIPKVKFKDLPCIYQEAKIFVYPSIVEGFGIPVLEAMASKVPVITSKDTSMAEIIQNDECLISATNKTELSEKIQEFLLDNNEKRIHQAFERSRAFSQEKFAQKLLKIYETI
tara:strand:- start:1673 stop:2776 length:1104 start_codon:yes stop_codon:yes gene_type:complete